MEERERVLFPNHLHAMGKLNYVKGERPKVDCILCAVRDNDKRVTALKVYQEKDFLISLNLYPYNPGHLMVIPSRHVEKFEDLKTNERNKIFKVVVKCQKMLNDLFSPSGFNVGYNEGNFSGASLKHIHVHVVPRYNNELGYIEIIGSTRIFVLPIDEVMEKVKRALPNYLSE